MKTLLKIGMVVGVFSMNYTVIKLMNPPIIWTSGGLKLDLVGLAAFLYPFIPALFIVWLLRKHQKNNQ